MKLGHEADEIKYDDTVDTITRYVVILEGKRVMDILCDSADPEKVIRIRPAGGKILAIAHDTAGRFTMTQKILENADGEPLGVEERVSEKSVYTYVVPRLHVLLARLLRAA
jgi:hypothetical protein